MAATRCSSNPIIRRLLIDALRTAVPRVNDPTLPAAAYAKVARDYTWTARCRHILSKLEKRRTKNEER